MDRRRTDNQLSECQRFIWLDAGARPLDMNGPTRRPFRRFRCEGLDQPIIAHLEQVALREPHRVALSDSQSTLTYQQLWDGLSGLAQSIAARTQPDDLVGILLSASIWVPLAMLACLAAGRPFAPIDTDYPDDWVDLVLADAAPALTISGDNLRAGAGREAAQVIRLTDLPPAAQPGWRPAQLPVDQPACVLYTSGSTGRPKAVINSQRGLLQRVAQSINAAHISEADALLTLVSPGTIVGVRDIMTALLAGGRIHIVDPRRIGAREILNIIRTETITILFAFPALLRSVVGSDSTPTPESLRLVRVGGDTTLWCDVDLLRDWLTPGTAIQLIYAATEAPMMQWFVDESCRGKDPRLPIGYPLSGNRLAVVDEAGCPAPVGGVGELVVASPYVALGVRVAGRFIPQESLPQDSSETSRCRLFRTGDIVRLRSDGLIERLGRKDRQIKIRGTRIDLDGVEAALRQHAFVRDVAAMTRTAPDDGVRIIAYVCPRDGAPADLRGELRALMRRSPAAMRPAHLYLIQAIPRLPSSKLDVRALMTLDEATRQSGVATCEGAGQTGQVPTDGVERAVARIWRDALGTPEPGPDDDFFELGGDSLMAITVVAELERVLGVELSVCLITEAPTFSALCAALSACQSRGYKPLVALKAGEGAPVFFVHGVGGTVADLLNIARNMTWPGPVVGIQARGLNRGERPQATVGAMARTYLRAIKERQPEGPYYLCGYSFGGLVAFEIARQMTLAGDEVGLVGLFDTLTSPLSWPAPSRRARVRQILIWLYGSLARVNPTARLTRGSLNSPPIRLLAVAAFGLLASARYRPGYYPGELKLFIPADREPSLPSLQSIWRGHANKLSVVSTTGGHLTMLSKPHARSTADRLTLCLPSSPV